MTVDGRMVSVVALHVVAKRKRTAYQEMDRVRRGLAKRFPDPAWVLLEEVANGTGGRATRRADAVAISCWPSRGLEIHGVEIKVQRNDWLRELKDPTKSEPVQRFCDRWWVAAPKGIVEREELPPKWGLLEVQKGGKLRAVVDAPKLEPVPLQRSFVAALARAMQVQVAGAEQRVLNGLQGDGEYEKGFEAGRVQGRHDAWAERQEELTEGKRAVESLKAFEQGAGFKVNHWRMRFIGSRMREILTGGTYQPLVADYARLRGTLARNLQIVDRELEAIKEMELFTHATDAEWERRLHAGSAHPAYEYRSTRSKPVGDGWEVNDDYDPALHEVTIEGTKHWRRRLEERSCLTTDLQP